MSIAVIIVLVILGLLGVLQVLLALGAPLGRFAWGGRHEVLPRNLRMGSVAALVIYCGIAIVVLSKSGAAQIIPEGLLLDVATWVIFVYSALGIVMNAVSRSKPERYIMTPTSALLAACVLAVILG